METGTSPVLSAAAAAAQPRKRARPAGAAPAKKRVEVPGAEAQALRKLRNSRNALGPALANFLPSEWASPIAGVAEWLALAKVGAAAFFAEKIALTATPRVLAITTDNLPHPVTLAPEVAEFCAWVHGWLIKPHIYAPATAKSTALTIRRKFDLGVDELVRAVQAEAERAVRRYAAANLLRRASTIVAHSAAAGRPADCFVFFSVRLPASPALGILAPLVFHGACAPAALGCSGILLNSKVAAAVDRIVADPVARASGCAKWDLWSIEDVARANARDAAARVANTAFI